MSATNELRAMLNERGVEWGASDTYRLLVTSWKDASGHDWAFMEHRDGSFSKLTAYHLTPAQAIEATLGRWECHLLSALQYGDDCKECSACGAVFDEYMFKSGRCPSCGAKVVDE